MNAPLRLLILALVVSGLSACTLGPDYQRPDLDIPEQYRQVQGWKPAAPADALERGAWWSRYDVMGDGSDVHTYSPRIGQVTTDGKADVIFVGQGWSGPGLNVRTMVAQ